MPDTRKAQAVKSCFEAQISPMAPASILRTHPNATLYLDKHYIRSFTVKSGFAECP